MENSIMYRVYVLSQDGKLLMPTKRFGKVRRMLRAGLAKVVKREPFTIQLRYESTEFTQLVTFGIDAGYSHIGFSAVTDREELISGEVKMLQGVKNRLEERAMYRRTRRNHLRYRRNNGVDEHKPLGWLAPSIEHKLETHLRLVD